MKCNPIFTWRMTSLSIMKTELLFYGFIKIDYVKYVPYDIVNLFIKYYDIDDDNAVKNETKSPIFCLDSFKWYLRIYRINNQIKICLILASNPPKIIRIQTSFKISITETNTELTKQYTFYRKKKR